MKKETKNRLNLHGKKNQTFDQLVNEILDHLEKCDRWWCENR